MAGIELVKRNVSQIKFILIGDFDQLQPVEFEKRSYYDSHLIK